MVVTASSAISRYTTWELDAILEQVRRPTTWFLDNYFAEEKYFPSNVVEYDVLDADVTLAPFVSPLQPGRPSTQRGMVTRQITTSYIKQTDLVTPQQAFVRRPGEPYGGARSPRQRFDEQVAEKIALHQDKLTARLEWMAVNALVSDGYTIQGENMPAQVVSFGRDSTLTLNLNGQSTAWDQASSTPLLDLETMALRVNILSKGAVVTDVVMNSNTWKLMRAHSTLQDLISAFYRNGGASADKTPITEAYKARMVADLGQLKVWVYDSYYRDDTGTSQPYLPDWTVLGLAGGSNGIMGRQYYGMIQDLAANMEPMKQFFKSDLKFEPSGLELVSQSAPLVGPKRPQASFRIIVK